MTTETKPRYNGPRDVHTGRPMPVNIERETGLPANEVNINDWLEENGFAREPEFDPSEGE